MEYFLETTETIIDGVGFTHYSLIHIAWLILFAGVTIANVIYYKKASPEKRSQWRKIIAALLIADELFKMAGLFIGGNCLSLIQTKQAARQHSVYSLHSRGSCSTAVSIMDQSSIGQLHALAQLHSAHSFSSVSNCTDLCRRYPTKSTGHSKVCGHSSRSSCSDLSDQSLTGYKLHVSDGSRYQQSALCLQTAVWITSMGIPNHHYWHSDCHVYTMVSL